MDDTPPEPLRAGSLADIDFGFTFPAASGAGERILAILRASGIEPRLDPELDERIANEPCPSCGRLLSAVPIGHAWSLDLTTHAYRCSDPPFPGGPTTFAMATSAELEPRPAGVVVPWKGR